MLRTDGTHSPLSFSQSGFLSSFVRSVSSRASALAAPLASACALSHCSGKQLFMGSCQSRLRVEQEAFKEQQPER